MQFLCKAAAWSFLRKATGMQIIEVLCGMCSGLRRSEVSQALNIQ